MGERKSEQRRTEPSALCWLCRQTLNPSDKTLVSALLSDGSPIYAHLVCVEGLKLILGVQASTNSEPRKLAGWVREINGEWILAVRQFPNQYAPVLVYFHLSRNEPKSTVDLGQWLARNDVSLSNPSMTIKRLADRSSLSVIVSEDGIKRYLLTDDGEAELMRYLDEMKTQRSG